MHSLAQFVHRLLQAHISRGRRWMPRTKLTIPGDAGINACVSSMGRMPSSSARISRQRWYWRTANARWPRSQ